MLPRIAGRESRTAVAARASPSLIAVCLLTPQIRISRIAEGIRWADRLDPISFRKLNRFVLRQCCRHPSRGCKRPQTASAKSRGVRKTERVCSRPWEVGFVARFGMTSCSPNFFNMSLGERDNMKPITSYFKRPKPKNRWTRTPQAESDH